MKIYLGVNIPYRVPDWWMHQTVLSNPYPCLFWNQWKTQRTGALLVRLTELFTCTVRYSQGVQYLVCRNLGLVAVGYFFLVWSIFYISGFFEFWMPWNYRYGNLKNMTFREHIGCSKFRVQIFDVSTLFGGPGGFRKFREVNWKIVPQLSSKMLRRVPSYDKKIEKVHDY